MVHRSDLLYELVFFVLFAIEPLVQLEAALLGLCCQALGHEAAACDHDDSDDHQADTLA